MSISEKRTASPSVSGLRGTGRPMSVNGDRSVGSSEHEVELNGARHVTFTAQRATSPSRHARVPGSLSPKPSQSTLLPDTLHISVRMGLIRQYFHVILDAKTLIENILLSATLAVAALKYNEIPKEKDPWMFLGM